MPINPHCVRLTSLYEELRVECAPTKASHIDSQLFHLVVKRSLRHLQQLESFVNPAVGPSQGKADEKSLQVLHDLIPGCLLSSPPQELLYDRSHSPKLGGVVPIEHTPRRHPHLRGKPLPIACEQLFHPLVLLAGLLDERDDQGGGKVVHV